MESSQLHDLERKFFTDLMVATLDVPTHATVSSKQGDVDVIVVPTILSDGEFVFRYYDAPTKKPEVTEYGLSMDFTEMEHPTLRQGKSVTLQLKTEPSFPFPTLFAQEQPPLSVIVHSSSMNTGLLLLDKGVVESEDFGVHLSKAEFFVSNLPAMAIPLYPLEEQPIVLTSGQWKIALNGSRTPSSRGGFVGTVEQYDGNSFPYDKLLDLLDVFSYFLSFVKSSTCAPSAVLGYDLHDKQKIVWGKITSFASEQPRVNWFKHESGIHSTDFFLRLFPRFSRMWYRNKETHLMVQRYVKSHEIGRIGSWGASFITCFAALEALADLVLVGNGRSKRSVRKLDSQKRIGSAINTADDTRRKFCGDRNIDRVYDIGEVKISGELLDLAEHLGATEQEEFGENELGSWLLAKARNYAVHFGGKVADSRYDRLAESERGYVFLHDLCSFYFEYIFLIYLGILDTTHPRRLLNSNEVMVS